MGEKCSESLLDVICMLGDRGIILLFEFCKMALKGAIGKEVLFFVRGGRGAEFFLWYPARHTLH